MIGIDTSFMIAHGMVTHPDHDQCRSCLDSLTRSGEEFLLSSAVVAEFIHVTTDAKRFTSPFTMQQALAQAMQWVDSLGVTTVSPDEADLEQFSQWMTKHQLGRKRILDTMLAATYFGHGATGLLTLNKPDFSIFSVFDFPLN